MVQNLKETKNGVFAGGKKTRDLISAIVDEKSFVEVATLSYSKSANIESDSRVGEGAVCGFAQIGGMPCYIAAQNPDSCLGAFDNAQAEKFLRVMSLAQKAGFPIVYLLASSGAKISDGIEAVEAYSKIISLSSQLYGEITQIAVAFGACSGMLSYFASQSDFIINMNGGSVLSSSPFVISAKGGVDVKKVVSGEFETSSGLSSFSCKDASELSVLLQKLLTNVFEDFTELDESELNKVSASLANGYSADAIVSDVLDGGEFLEIFKGFGAIRTGFANIGGYSVGVAICPDGNFELDVKSAKRLSRFLRLLDNMEKPFVSFVNVSGVELSIENEKNGIIRDVGCLMSAVSDLSMPKVSVVCGKAVGAGYAALCSKGLGYDYLLAWTGSTISVVDGMVGANTEYAEELAKAKDPTAARAALAKKFEETEGNAMLSARRGLVDNIIEPDDTRKNIIAALVMLNV